MRISGGVLMMLTLAGCGGESLSVENKPMCIVEVARRLTDCAGDNACEKGVARFAGYCYNEAPGDQLDICRGGQYFFQQPLEELGEAHDVVANLYEKASRGHHSLRRGLLQLQLQLMAGDPPPASSGDDTLLSSLLQRYVRAMLVLAVAGSRYFDIDQRGSRQNRAFWSARAQAFGVLPTIPAALLMGPALWLAGRFDLPLIVPVLVLFVPAYLMLDRRLSPLVDKIHAEERGAIHAEAKFYQRDRPQRSRRLSAVLVLSGMFVLQVLAMVVIGFLSALLVAAIDHPLAHR